MPEVEQYYALCVEWEGGKTEIALLELGRDEVGRLDAIAVYTSPDGPVQQEDLKKWKGNIWIQKASHGELLNAMQRKYPRSVFIDGQKVAGSVFTGMLKTELGLPMKHPRLVRLEEPDPE